MRARSSDQSAENGTRTRPPSASHRMLLLKNFVRLIASPKIIMSHILDCPGSHWHFRPHHLYEHCGLGGETGGRWLIGGMRKVPQHTQTSCKHLTTSCRPEDYVWIRMASFGF